VTRFVLIGLCEPPDADSQAGFDEWFVDQHIEDTARCPNVVRGSVYRLSGPHLDAATVSEYLSIYEVEASSYAEAERVLNEWQADPDAWAGRENHWQTARRLGGAPLAVKGSGWYELLASYDGSGTRRQ
jgi:predicted nucleic acid-binding Zn ribbon protein